MSDPAAVVLQLPFRGTWRVENSPARRVPSHGTHLFATTYAIDFTAVQDGRTATTRDWRSLLTTEPVERFFAFGQPVLAPAAGRVVAVHDGESDAVARRSQAARVPYALTQAGRARVGGAALAGNHVVLRLEDGRTHVLLAHLRAGSLRVSAGDEVTAGEQVGECGNSGNSTQPHVHVQAMDAADAGTARGLPLAFGDHRSWPRDGGPPAVVPLGVPAEGAVVEPL